MDTTLTVIVPVYNCSLYLDKCINSIINQTYRKLEIICIDDGSTDDSLAILKKFSTIDSRIRVLSQKNCGSSAARNLGLKNSTGEYITFVDADDYIDSDTYRMALQAFDNHNIDIVNFGIVLVDSHFNELDSSYHAINRPGKILLNSEALENTKWEACSKIFKRSIIDQFQISFPIGLYFEDMVFTKKYLAVSRYIYNLPGKFYFYVQRHNSIMSTLRQKNTMMHLDYFKCFKSIYEFYKINHIPINQLMLNLFKFCCDNAIRYAKKNQLKRVFEEANNVIDYAYLNKIFIEDPYIRAIIDQKYWKLSNQCFSLIQRIFLIYKRGNRLCLNFLGLRIKLFKIQQKNKD